MTIQNDIDAILADAADTFGAGGPAVDVTIGAETVKGLLHRSDEPILEGAVARSMGEQIRVTVATGALSGLAVNVAVTVDAVPYRVREIQKAGQLTRFLVTAVS